VKILGLLLTFVENRTVFGRQIQQQLREHFGDLVCKTVIHRTVRLLEAPSAGESVLTYAPESKGATEYLALAEERMYDKPLALEMNSDEVSEGKINDAKALVDEISSEKPPDEEIIDNESLAAQTSGDEPMSEPGGDDRPMAVEVSPEQSSGEYENNDEPLAAQTSGDEPMAEQTTDANPSAVELNNDVPSTEETNNG
jgi:hypothetical protein